MNFDLKTAIGSIAPTLATMLGGPLAGTAVSAIAAAFGMSPSSTLAQVSAQVQTAGLTPEAIVALKEADLKHAEIMGQQGIDLAKINADHDQALTVAVIDDRKNARQSNSGKDATWLLAASILLTFAIIMGAVLWGCWTLLMGGITIKDPSVVAAISGLVGAVVGYVAANAHTVVNFVFGGSLGSEKKTDSMSTAVQQALSVAGTAAKNGSA
jgi:hypothetical protein